MSLETAEEIVRWTGRWLAVLMLALIFAGIWQGTRQPVGKTTGSSPGLLRSPLFYGVTSAVFFGVCFLLWRPLPLDLTPVWRWTALILGSLLYFPGMAFILWARLALGKMYFVSTGRGAQLFAGHRLVTHGPFAFVRHPIYLGLTVAAVGGLFLFQTWTLVIFLLIPLGLVRRAKVEERVLAAAFGPEWLDYCRRVPAWFPRL